MEFFIIIVHVLAALAIIGLVLIQHGKGADMGAAFGSGASQTMFGSVGTGNVLTKSTTWLAVIFFATSLGLAIYARQQADQGVQNSSLIQNAGQLQDLISAGAANTPPVDGDVPTGAAPLTDEQVNQAVQSVLDSLATDSEVGAADAAQDAAAATATSDPEAAPQADATENENALEEAQQ